MDYIGNIINEDIVGIDTFGRVDIRRINKVNRMRIKLLSYILVSGPIAVNENSGAQYECNAYYTDGTIENVTNECVWSEDSIYAEIDQTGYLTTHEVPSIDAPLLITAEWEGLSNSLPVTIIDVVQLLSITIEGPVTVNENSGAQFNCRAYYDNGNNALVSPTWSENSIYASINGSGYLSTSSVPNADQPCTLTANFGGKSDTHNITIKNIVQLLWITITGPGYVDERSGAQFYCTAYYDDSTSLDVTNLATWSDLSPYATINPSTGYLTTGEVPNADQSCLLHVEYGGKGDDFGTIIRNIVLLDHITIEGPINVNENSGAQFNCRAYYDNGTNALVDPMWSDNSIYASINVLGYLTTGDVQHVNRVCTITANYSGKSDTHAITIVNIVELSYITITGPNQVDEQTQTQYTCTAYWDNGTNTNITNTATWSQNKIYASISSTGLLTVNQVISDDTLTITANYQTKSDTHAVLVKDIINIPTGLIVFFNSSVIPSGWSRYSLPDNRMIIGAGGTLNPNDSGVLNISTTTGSAGSHVHPNINYGYWVNSPSGFNYGALFGPHYLSGVHAHQVDITHIPARNQVTLIKNNSPKSQLPNNSIVCCMEEPKTSGFTNLYTNGNYLSSGSTISSLPQVDTINVLSTGYHTHGQDGTVYIDDIPPDRASQSVWDHGLHSSSTPANTLTPNIRRLLLSLWTKATLSFDIDSKMIAMWESLTPPTGWVLCDGTHETPDLRDCFIKPVSSGGESITPVGDNTADLTLDPITHSAAHNHVYSFYTSAKTWRSSYEWDINTWSHTHPGITTNDIPFLPPYYALSFIMKE